MLNGSVEIDFDHIPLDHVLLTFTNDQSNENVTAQGIDCWSEMSESVVVSKSFESDTQMFCLMEKEEKTVSPFDCLSILPRNGGEESNADTVWLTEDDKALAIGLLVTGLILCMILGISIGILIVKRKANSKNSGNERQFSRPDLITDWRNDQSNAKVSYPYTDSDTISVASDSSNYVPAVNPSRFDLIKMQLEKSENPDRHESKNLYDLEDMPYLKVYETVDF